MKTIYYSLCGEGLGHASRALSLEQHLEANYVYFTYGGAYDYLKSLNKNVHKIDGLSFVFNSNGSVNNLKSFFGGIKFLIKNKEQFNGKPDLCISDWEPTLYSYAKSIDVPIISMTSQHKFRFPKKYNLKAYNNLLRLMCYLYKADHYIVSTFQFEDVQQSDLVTPVYGFISNKLKRQESDGSLLVYANSQSLIDKITKTFQDIYDMKIYGPGSDRSKFHGDLVSCERVASTTGCQLISECGNLGIPMHLYPIANQYEQLINAQDAEKLNIGIIENGKEYEHEGQILQEQFFTKKYVGLNGAITATEVIKKFL